MTLKEFADQEGIGYNLAKQWKARGKIVTEGDGYRLVTEPKRGRLQKPGVTDIENEVTVQMSPKERTPVTIGILNAPPGDSSEVTAPAAKPGVNVTREEYDALLARVVALEAGQEKAKQDVIELYGAAGECDKRITVLEDRHDPGYSVTVERMAPGESLARRGSIDPPGPQWGA